MSHPYALHIATPAGPRSKVDPNSVVLGPDSANPDAHAQQYDPATGPGNYDNCSGFFEGLAGKYTVHPVPHLTARQAHALTYLIRAGLFTPDEVLRMSDALR